LREFTSGVTLRVIVTPQSSDSDSDLYYSHWADHAARRTVAANPEAKTFVVAAGITPSGVVHVGNFREVITVDLVARALRDRGLEVRFIYSWDDFDVFRRVPESMPKPEMLEANLRRSVADVPDPYGEHDSFASHHIANFEESLQTVGIEPEFIRQSQRYRRGDYASGIRRALECADTIRRILDRHRSAPLPEPWLPLAGFCPACGKDDLDFAWDGEWNVTRSCRGCGECCQGDLREGGDLKLPWRVDWPMRWQHEGVLFEPGGKDHSSAGGSYDTGREIVAEVYAGQAPEYVAYDFVRLKGRGGKISSSQGESLTLADCLEIYEPEMLRWIFASVRPGAEFQISFDLDVIKLYEEWDRFRRLACGHEGGKRAEKKRQLARRTLELVSVPPRQYRDGGPLPFIPGFRHLSMVLQVYDGNAARARAHYEQRGEITSDEERRLFDRRAASCWRWIESYAPDDFCYRIRSAPVKRSLNGDQRTVLTRVVDVLAAHPDIDEETLIPHLKTMCEGTSLEPAGFFPLVYDLLLDREKGPKFTTLVTAMGTERALPLLRASLE
jgi:lysyl-tRNA synthetase class 1